MGEASGELTPPPFTIRWCPLCGANDRYTTLGKVRHWNRGQLCRGVPVVITYTALVKDAANE